MGNNKIMFPEVKHEKHIYVIWSYCDIDEMKRPLGGYDNIEDAAQDFVELQSFARDWGHTVWLSGPKGPIVVRYIESDKCEFCTQNAPLRVGDNAKQTIVKNHKKT